MSERCRGERVASLFVSHSRHDARVTAELVGWLRAAGFQALFVDFDPDFGIPAGRSWERELYAQLRRADGVLYVASPAANASRWCFAELSLARSIGKPIFPVLVAGPERLSLLADVQWVDLRGEDGGAGLQRLLHGLQRAGLDARDGFGWDPGRSPYPGLDPFRAEDAAVFFGRTAEIGELLDRLTPTLQRGRGQFLAVVGPSGSGKSSLVAAGLLSRLARRGWITLPRVVPGERPLTHLARSLAQAFRVSGVSGGGPDAAAVERHLQEGGSPGLVALAQHLCDRASPAGAVVFVDQAEELITRTGPAERTRFLRLLRGALQPDSPLSVVATLRSEFLGPSLVGAGLAEIVDDTVVVGPVSRERLFEVIEKPARRAGLDFEAGLVPRMVDDTVGGDRLPLLAYTLRQLYERFKPGRPITHADYEAVGGVVGALRRQADAVMRTLAPRHPQHSVLAVLLRLVSVERGGEPVRRRVRREALGADEDEIVQAFVDARLLRSDELDDEVVIEVAHEALLRQWKPLRAAVEASRRTLELRSEIEEDAHSWDQAGREDSYLLRGVRLAAAEELSEDYVHDLGVLEQEFLSASRTLAGKELETARRSNRRLRRLAAGLITFLVLAVAASSLAAVRTVAAERAEQKARSRQLAAQAVALLDTRPETALLLALEAVRTAGTTEAVAALQDGLSRPHHVATQLLGHENTVYDVVFSPDGSTLASAGWDRTVRLWDVRTRRPLGGRCAATPAGSGG